MAERDGQDNPIPLIDAEAIAPSTWTTEIGLVAVGGTLTPGRVLSAYASGVFPWPLLGEGEPVLWCSPHPRFVLFPDEFHVPRSLARAARRNERTGAIELRIDSAFERVIRACGQIRRRDQQGTWITSEMIEVYTELHRAGHAHSVEAWRGSQLVGGLYGIALGRVFFGESMFAREPDASKLALKIPHGSADSVGVSDWSTANKKRSTCAGSARARYPETSFSRNLRPIWTSPATRKPGVQRPSSTS